MVAAKHNLSAVRKGDTFDGAIFRVSTGGAPVDLTGYSITVEFRRTRTDEPELVLTLTKGLSMVSATDGRFQINPQVFPFREGMWLYLVRFVSPAGRIKTWVEGQIEITL